MHRFVETSGDVQQPRSPRAEAEGLEDHQAMDADPEITVRRLAPCVLRVVRLRLSDIRIPVWGDRPQ